MRIGVDLGGSHIAVGLVYDEGTIKIKKEKDLKKDFIEIEIEQTIIEFIEEIIKEEKIKKEDIQLIGIAAPGSIQDNKIKYSSNLGLNNFDIVNKIKKYYKCPIYIKNDAKCAAIAEKKYGNLKKYNNCVFLTIGTGIGGAVFFNNELLTPKKYEGFELGHIIIEKNGKDCKCGKKGCFEQYASITALKENVRKEYNIKEKINGKQLLDLIKEKTNDKKMQKILKEYIENLAIGISNIINIFEPEAICIGGSFTHYEDLILNELIQVLKNSNLLFNKEIPPILMAKTKNDAGIIGATNI